MTVALLDRAALFDVYRELTALRVEGTNADEN
jgi:hypothetical protein